MNVKLGGLNRDTGVKGHTTFVVVKVYCRCGNTGYRTSNGSYLRKESRIGLELSMIGNRLSIIADLAENMVFRNEKTRDTVESMIGSAAPESTEEPSCSAVEKLATRMAELKAKSPESWRGKTWSSPGCSRRTDPSGRRPLGCAQKSRTLPRPITTRTTRTDCYRPSRRDITECFTELAAG